MINPQSLFYTTPDPDIGFAMPFPQPTPNINPCPCIHCTKKEDIIAAKPVRR